VCNYWENETDLIKLHWYQPVQVVGHHTSEHLDIMVWDKSDKCAYLTDVNIPTFTKSFVKGLQSTVTW